MVIVLLVRVFLKSPIFASPDFKDRNRSLTYLLRFVIVSHHHPWGCSEGVAGAEPPGVGTKFLRHDQQFIFTKMGQAQTKATRHSICQFLETRDELFNVRGQSYPELCL